MCHPSLINCYGQLLRSWFPDAQTLILGDLSQRNPTTRGVRSWQDLETVGFAPPVIYSLTVNYRSAPPVVRVLNQLGRRLQPAVGEMRGIEREAPNVLSLCAKDADSLTGGIVHLLRHNPHETAAVLFRSAADADEGARWLERRLKPLGQGARRLVPDAAFPEGIVVAARDEVVGLEFDMVVVADADASTYPVDPVAASDLYVLASRAQNRLAFAFVGSPTPLLAGVQLTATAYEESSSGTTLEGRWSGAGAYGKADVGWGFDFPRGTGGRWMTDATPGIAEDRYDEESGPDD